jgi:hypothetical protein
MRGQHNKRTRGWRNKSKRNNQPAQEDKGEAGSSGVRGQQEGGGTRGNATTSPAGEMRQQEAGTVRGQGEDKRAA